MILLDVCFLHLMALNIFLNSILILRLVSIALEIGVNKIGDNLMDKFFGLPADVHPDASDFLLEVSLLSNFENAAYFVALGFALGAFPIVFVTGVPAEVAEDLPNWVPIHSALQQLHVVLEDSVLQFRVEADVNQIGCVHITRDASPQFGVVAC